MKSHVASRQPGLCHEAYGIMLADCFAFQTGIVAGDANMSGYRFGGSRQGSASLKHSCWQDMMRDPNCRVIPWFVSANSQSSLRWWEDTFGQEYDQCRPLNWDTVPTLDCIVCCILEWAHSTPMEKCSTEPPGLEFKIAVSDWLLHSFKEDYLFSPSDKDSHTPLLVHLNPRYFTPADVPAQMRPETKMGSKLSRKERQKPNKAQGAGATSYSVGCGTAKNDTGKTKFSGADNSTEASGTAAPVTPPKSAPAFDKGKFSAKGKGNL